jgi:hypothetical protein
MMNGRPFQPMLEADKGGQGGSGSGAGDQGQGDGGQGDGGSGDGGGNGDQGQGQGDQGDGQGDGGEGDKKKVTFDDEQQSFINNLINKTIKEERTKAEAERKKQEERAKMDAKEKAEAELKDANEKIKALNEKSLSVEIKDVARESGVSAKKLERFLKVVDRDGLMDDDGNIDQAKVKKAVDAVLGDMPEFKGPEDKKGPGDFSGGGGGSVKYSLAQIQAMSTEEVAKDYDEVMKSMSFHNKQK